MIRIFNQYVSLKSFLLMIVEALLIVLSLICAVKLRFWNNTAEFDSYLTMPDFAGQAANHGEHRRDQGEADENSVKQRNRHVVRPTPILFSRLGRAALVFLVDTAAA